MLLKPRRAKYFGTNRRFEFAKCRIEQRLILRAARVLYGNGGRFHHTLSVLGLPISAECKKTSDEGDRAHKAATQERICDLNSASDAVPNAIGIGAIAHMALNSVGVIRTGRALIKSGRQGEKRWVEHGYLVVVTQCPKKIPSIGVNPMLDGAGHHVCQQKGRTSPPSSSEPLSNVQAHHSARHCSSLLRIESITLL